MRAAESRRLVTIRVPGLSGDLHQDPGRGAAGIAGPPGSPGAGLDTLDLTVIRAITWKHDDVVGVQAAIASLDDIHMTLNRSLDYAIQRAQPHVVSLWYEAHDSSIASRSVLALIGAMKYSAQTVMWVSQHGVNDLIRAFSRHLGRVLIRFNCNGLRDQKGRASSACTDVIAPTGSPYARWCFRELVLGEGVNGTRWAPTPASPSVDAGRATGSYRLTLPWRRTRVCRTHALPRRGFRFLDRRCGAGARQAAGDERLRTEPVSNPIERGGDRPIACRLAVPCRRVKQLYLKRFVAPRERGQGYAKQPRRYASRGS